jgi:hypothetical protein
VGVFNYKDIYCEMKDLIRHILREHNGELSEAKFSNYEVSDEPYANIFYVFITEYNKSKGFEKSNLKRAFQYAIREYTNKPHKLISKKVADIFILKFPNSSPFNVRYSNRKKFGILDNNQGVLLFEHTTPVAFFLASLANSKTLEEVKQAMKEYSGVCLLTREEDDCLNTKGYRQKRPQGWKLAYESCNIQVMDESQFNTYKQQKLNSTEDETTD